MAVLINGGAFGQISDKDRQIYLGGDGAIGGIVDGRYHQINSSYTETEDTSTELVNYAKIDTGAENVTGFVTRNGGLLVNYGVINMTNGANATGIHVLQGGRLENHGNITISNGIGLHAEGIIGTDTSSNILNDASITVNDGRAGIYLEKNAFLNAMTSQGQINVAGTAHGVLLASDAKGIMLGTEKITVLQNSTGNGIENNITSSDKNYAAPIAFKNTTINVLSDGSSGGHNDNGNGGNNNSGNSSSNSHNNNGSAGNSDSGNGSSNSLINNNNDGNNSSGSGSENRNGSNNASSEKGKTVTSHKPFYGPSVPLYEAYPQVLLNLNQLPTLQQRVGTRFWNSNDGHNNNTCRDLDDQTPSEIENCGIWGRMEGSTGKVTPDHSPTEQNYKIDLLRMQAGVDGSLKENQYGTLI